MADEKDPNASGPSEEGIIIPQGALIPEAGGPSESTEGVIIHQAEQPGDDAPPQQAGILIEF